MAILRQNDFMETAEHNNTVAHYALGLTEAEVRRLQDILRRECGMEVTLEVAWARAIELLALFRMLLGPFPGDARDASSNIVAIDESRVLRN